MSHPQSHDALLLTLEEVSRLVSHSHEPGETLNNIVHLIQTRFATDVCSVYLLDRERGELTLSATVGLEPNAVGRVRMRLNEGLTGLVAQESRPVMVEDALRHPRFKYFPEAGEDPYHSFLGVPLVERGVVGGVLVLQNVDPRPFSPGETRMLTAVACQLAPLVSSAGLLQRVLTATHAVVGEDAPRLKGPLRGLPLSQGTGVGEAYVLDLGESLRDPEPQADPAQEVRRFRKALQTASEELVHLSQRISNLVGEEHGAILQAQLMILQDSTIERDVVAGIDTGLSAEASLRRTLEKYSAAFQRLSSAFFQERVYDVKDVARRLLWHLRPMAGGPSAAADQIVLVSPEVSVMELFTVDLDKLAGVVVERGGVQSHAAILARSLGIPMVGQLPCAAGELHGEVLLVDGTRGLVEVNPSPETVSAQAVERVTEGPGPSPPALAPEMPKLQANINLLSEVETAIRFGAEGVGLYRTELVFLARRTLPTEDEQFRLYSKLLKMLDGRPASIRTFDLRPEKVHPQLAATAGDTLDWRCVLSSPSMQRIFRDQVRAIMRAAGQARILVPLVSRSEQLDFVLETVERAREELETDGHQLEGPLPLGVMIEAPAALALVEAWGPQVDFFAVGTNDLVAAALGIERNDASLAEEMDHLHPGVLHLLHQLIESARASGRPVCVCGEMAGEPLGALALAALGVDSVSVAAHRLSAVREVLATRSHAELAALVPEILSARTADRVREILGSTAAS